MDNGAIVGKMVYRGQEYEAHLDAEGNLLVPSFCKDGSEFVVYYVKVPVELLETIYTMTKQRYELENL